MSHKNAIQRACADLSEMLAPVIDTVASGDWDGEALSADRRIDHLRGAENLLLQLKGACDTLAEDDRFWKGIELMYSKRINRQLKLKAATIDAGEDGSAGGHIDTPKEAAA